MNSIYPIPCQSTVAGSAEPNRNCVPAAVTKASDPWLSICAKEGVSATSDLIYLPSERIL